MHNRGMGLLRIDDILFSQGFGTRRLCAGLLQQGHVTVNGQTVTDAAALFDVTGPGGLSLSVQGQPWQYQAQAYLMLHKPAGTECSQKPSAWPSIYTLLPAPLRQRPRKSHAPGVQAVGRLDQDTTGLLLLTDDGLWLHRLSSPKHHVPKVYEVTTCHPLDDGQLQHLQTGVVLDDDPRPIRASAALRVAPHQLRLTLTEGKYHQVKRMVAAVGNRVQALHRSRIGALALPPQLAPGQWRWLTPQERQSVTGPG